MSAGVVHAAEPIAGFIAGGSRLWCSRYVVVYNRQHVVSDLLVQSVLSYVAARTAHVIMAVSRASAETAVSLEHVHRSRLCVAHNGAPELRRVPRSEAQAIARKHGVPSGTKVILAVARLRREKGLDVLISAMPRVLSLTREPVNLVIVGEGSYGHVLRALAAESSARATIHFVGHQTDVAPWYSIADVMVVPSYQDASPFVLVEAMSAGLPIVASDVGGIPEMIEPEQSGLLIPRRDPRSLADALVRILGDPVLGRALGHGARRRYERDFSVPAMVQRWLAVYDKAWDLVRNRSSIGATAPAVGCYSGATGRSLTSSEPDVNSELPL